IDHPQLRLDAQTLDLAFDQTSAPASPTTPTTAPAGAVNLKSVAAAGNVSCVMIDPKSPDRTIHCDRLQLAIAQSDDHKPYPQLFVATGNVSTSDGDQRL